MKQGQEDVVHGQVAWREGVKGVCVCVCVCVCTQVCTYCYDIKTVTHGDTESTGGLQVRHRHTHTHTHTHICTLARQLLGRSVEPTCVSSSVPRTHVCACMHVFVYVTCVCVCVVLSCVADFIRIACGG